MSEVNLEKIKNDLSNVLDSLFVSDIYDTYDDLSDILDDIEDLIHSSLDDDIFSEEDDDNLFLHNYEKED